MGGVLSFFFLFFNKLLFDTIVFLSTEDDPAPKAKSYYTVLCLDISDSMQENGAFDQMKQIVEDFINGQFCLPCMLVWFALLSRGR